ncbi:MAG: hypothetical protein LBO71_02290 [Prevotellaceae bacterium]|nr:hypothetical protein [Prevotellaceae bacterium]
MPSFAAVIPSEARNLPASLLPLAAMGCDGRGKLRWSAGRFLRSARSCLARSGRNDGCERGNDGCEWGNDDRGRRKNRTMQKKHGAVMYEI